MVFISIVNNYMFRPKATIFRLLFEQNYNSDNLKMAALGRNM